MKVGEGCPTKRLSLIITYQNMMPDRAEKRGGIQYILLPIIVMVAGVLVMLLYVLALFYEFNGPRVVLGGGGMVPS